MRLLLYLFSFVPFALSAQCFTIETLLADACGDPEGENEMVTIRVNTDLVVDNLVFDWPNNNFLDWCPDANLTDQLNQTIISSCGILLEPPNGIVPSGSKLIVVSSTNMLINANSFQGLSDTLYIIYQCSGNTTGHFSNSSNGPRTLRVDYTGNCIGSQTVSYTGSDLIGGDGAAIFYDESGIGTYYNTGCNAPVPSLNPFWRFTDKICEDHPIVDLNTLLTNNATLGGIWSGDIENDNFFNPDGKLGAYSITYTLEDTSGCLGTVDSTLIFEVETAKFGSDSFEFCDSIIQFGTIFYEDTVVDILIENTNPFRCDSTLSRFYKINKSSYTISPDSITINSGESFSFAIEGTNPFEYQFWNTLGDTCFFDCAETNIEASDNGPFFFRIRDNLSGCEKLLQIEVEVKFYSELNVPNAFTPNNDGSNDFFKVYGKDIQTINYSIFSKWGERVFTTNSILDSWDGNFKNQSLESGIYILYLKASGKDGQSYERLEKLRLIR